MGVAYDFTNELGVALQVWVGKITLEEWSAHVRRQLADPAYPPPGKRSLADLRFARLDPAVGSPEIQQIVALYVQYRSKVTGMRMAIVTGEDFERVRVFERLIAPLRADVIVFNNFSTACLWLPVERNAAEALAVRLREMLQAAAGPAQGRENAP